MDRRSLLRFRSVFLSAVRAFFLDRGYLEVDTPVRLPVLIPEAEIQPFASEDWWLHTSPELCMKQLLATGVDRIFQICHCFRKGEQGRLHRPEFTMLEWYRGGWDYRCLMEEVEEFFSSLLDACAHFPGVRDSQAIFRQGRIIACSRPWKRMSVAEAFCRHGGMSVDAAMREDLFDEILVTRIEPNLGWDSPLFLYDYPASLASLARKRPDNPGVAERFELYIGGVELANGFSELVDPDEQRCRFLKERSGISRQGRIPPAMPETFLRDLALLGETAGIALGLDRLLLILLDGVDLAAVQTIEPTI